MHLINGNIKSIYRIFQQLEMDIGGYSYFTYYMTCSILDDAVWSDNPGDIVRCIAIIISNAGNEKERLS